MKRKGESTKDFNRNNVFRKNLDNHNEVTELEIHILNDEDLDIMISTYTHLSKLSI